MRSVKRTGVRSALLVLAMFFFFSLSAQENSPFSRYGLGDIYPQQNIASRGMGGVSAAYVNEQALNTINPASYSAMRYINVFGGSKGALVSYDVGISIDNRILRSAEPAESYKSTNFIPSYIQVGIPLFAKANARKRGIGLVAGLKPATRINYSVQSTEPGEDYTKETLYEGSGGLNVAFIGLAKRWNNFSIGFNTGYEFGRKELSTKVILTNDTFHYYKSNSSSITNFYGFFFNPGITYNIKLSEVEVKNRNYKEGYFLRLGASATLKQTLKASADINRETFEYSENTGTITIDSIYKSAEEKGEVIVPLTYTAGFMLSKKYIAGDEALASKWAFGADYAAGMWKDFRYYDKSDGNLINSWMLRAGAEFVPSLLSNNLFNRAIYRIGAYTGKDYINADGNEYKVRAVTFGLGFNLRKWNNYDNQSTMINTAIEFGKRGSGVNNVTENFFKISLGLSLADLWFARRKYD